MTSLSTCTGSGDPATLLVFPVTGDSEAQQCDGAGLKNLFGLKPFPGFKRKSSNNLLIAQEFSDGYVSPNTMTIPKRALLYS
ncbi:Hypothetical predicted protein [Olea europaea subsp. europaea]|uniref:Uncharacterized protein n=1 Tax=Olea europaea subsp. europaea TaxID=158383 RepID=A0A8S0UAR0_OLEEU|nr:Hypothetical predicted protein [Olea europaea subsp. europaea]